MFGDLSQGTSLEPSVFWVFFFTRTLFFSSPDFQLGVKLVEEKNPPVFFFGCFRFQIFGFFSRFHFCGDFLDIEYKGLL